MKTLNLKMAKIFEITNDLKLHVEVGQYGKYVKLFRNEKWISISENSWKFIKNNAELINQSMQNDSDYSLTLTTNKSIQVGMFLNCSYLSFCEKYSIEGEERCNYINLNDNEWQHFWLVIPNVNQVLKSAVVYRVGNEWSFVSSPKFDEYKFISKVSDDDVNYVLAAYLIEQQVEALVQEECDTCSCREEFPDDAQAFQEHFGTHINKYFNTALIGINIDRALMKLNKALNWNVKEQSFFGETQKLRKVAVTPSLIQPAYCKDFALIMRNTLDKLSF